VILFVGERKSPTAVRRGWSWKDGRLAARQLFDALEALNIDPATCEFANAYERGHIKLIRSKYEAGAIVVAMGQKAQSKLNSVGIRFRAMIHPAARGRIRNKQRYTAHVREVLA
jgi:hypothetical protein